MNASRDVTRFKCRSRGTISSCSPDLKAQECAKRTTVHLNLSIEDSARKALKVVLSAQATRADSCSDRQKREASCASSSYTQKLSSRAAEILLGRCKFMVQD